jgi:hypothetical protein
MEECMITKNYLKKNLTRWVIWLILLGMMAACAGGGSQPPATGAPPEPTSAPATTYPYPGGYNPYPPAIDPYPPAGQNVAPYPYPLQPYPAPLLPYPAPWQPQAADQSLQRGEAFVEGMDILVMESFPPQFALSLRGTLPTPCHQLRVEMAPPDGDNRIQVSVYSVVDPNMICAQVLAPFEASVPIQGLPSGQYTVVVNGEQAGSIEVP